MPSQQTTEIDLSTLPSGALPYTLKNDYMFKAVLQQNRKALTGLVSALLHLAVEDIVELEILNPIELGKSYQDKDCVQNSTQNSVF